MRRLNGFAVSMAGAVSVATPFLVETQNFASVQWRMMRFLNFMFGFVTKKSDFMFGFITILCQFIFGFVTKIFDFMFGFVQKMLLVF